MTLHLLHGIMIIGMYSSVYSKDITPWTSFKKTRLYTPNSQLQRKQFEVDRKRRLQSRPISRCYRRRHISSPQIMHNAPKHLLKPPQRLQASLLSPFTATARIMVSIQHNGHRVSHLVVGSSHKDPYPPLIAHELIVEHQGTRSLYKRQPGVIVVPKLVPCRPPRTQT